MNTALALLWLAIGWLLGYMTRKDDVVAAQQKVRSMIADKQGVKPGVIHRPSAPVLFDSHLPPKIQQEQQAMRESLRDAFPKETHG
jgi:hypothetical protein